MDLDVLNQLDTSIFIFDGGSYFLIFANNSALNLFPNLETQAIKNFDELFPNTNLPRLLKRSHQGKKAQFVIDMEIGQSQRPIQFSIKSLNNGTLLLEGTDYSAVRETELMLKSYSELIEKKNRQYQREQRRVERLLFNTLPEKCVFQLKQYGKTHPECFDEVSVLFLDFVGFTELSQQMSTSVLFSELNEIFTAFDKIVSMHRCERIKTIGDAYLAVCGMPEKIEHHAELITSAAYEMRNYIQERNKTTEYTWNCRIGIHTGEVTGGIVGRLKYIYDIFGDGVNTASRMESYSTSMQINLSKQTSQLLSDAYSLIPRGMVEVKGKGLIEMFFLDEIKGAPCAERLIPAQELLIPDDANIPIEDFLNDEFMQDVSIEPSKD